MSDPTRRRKISDVGADHKYVTMRKINKAQDTVDHGVPERYQRIDRAERDTVDQLLKKLHFVLLPLIRYLAKTDVSKSENEKIVFTSYSFKGHA